MPTVTTVQGIRDYINADDAAAYKEGVSYEVTIPSEYEPELHKYMRLEGWREPVNYMLDEVKEAGKPTGKWVFFMVAWDREWMTPMLAAGEKLTEIAVEHGRARLREVLGD